MNTPVRHNIGAFPSYMWKSEAIIINRLISEILKRDFSISVFDGEEYSVRRSHDRKEVQRAVAATDETQFRVRNKDDEQVAWFYMVHGNLTDVIADFVIAADHMSMWAPVRQTIEKLEN